MVSRLVDATAVAVLSTLFIPLIGNTPPEVHIFHLYCWKFLLGLFSASLGIFLKSVCLEFFFLYYEQVRMKE